MKRNTAPKTARAGQNSAEHVGRKYSQTRWGVHSRMVGGKLGWSGLSNYKTYAEAKEHFDKVCSNARFVPCGGVMLDLGATMGDVYEVRIVRIESQCEVLGIGSHR